MAGNYDAAFTLYATNTTGIAVAGPVTNYLGNVTNGLFTTQLDFGNAFTGSNTWLESAVRTNGTGAFTPLTPRQPVTPAPYAIYAENLNGASSNLTLQVNSATALRVQYAYDSLFSSPLPNLIGG